MAPGADTLLAGGFELGCEPVIQDVKELRSVVFEHVSAKKCGFRGVNAQEHRPDWKVAHEALESVLFR